MYKERVTFMKDFFQKSSRDFRKTNVFSMNKSILDLPISEIQAREEIFLDKYLLSKKDYGSAKDFIQSHFMREFQYENLHRIKITGYSYLFKDIGGEIWNKESYNLWKEFSGLMGDRQILLIEDDFTMGEFPLGFNFYFPLTMSWEEFYEGGYISATLLYENFYSYFMFGNSMNWFRYIETDGHREVLDNGEIDIVCNDYLGLNTLTPEIESILNKLGFTRV